MRKIGYPAAALAVLLASTAAAAARQHGKFHHELRGEIVKVEPDKNEFTVKTNQGEVAVCFIDDKSVVERGGKKIKLDEVRPGDRAYCHCSAEKNGRHYSVELQINKDKP